MMGKRLCACALWSSERAVSTTGGSVRTSVLPSERNQSHNLPLSLSHHSQNCQIPLMESICVYLCFPVRLVRNEMRCSCFVLLMNAQGPTGRSLSFPSQQGTLLLHGLHEEA